MQQFKRILALVLAVVMIAGLMPVSAAATNNEAAAVVPTAAGVTSPFYNSTTNPHYRIPAIVTMGDGALVAAADLRNFAWDSTDDNSDIDTVVAISTDNGKTWNTETVNDTRYGSTTNIHQSGTYIDPALATDGEKVYLLVDLFPGQSSERNSSGQAQAGTGMDENGYLKLSTDRSNYNYYLKDGRIYSYSGDVDQGYTVDDEFNFTNGSKSGNLFNYDNGSFYPYMTSYLCVVIGTYADGEITWESRTLVNDQVKHADEKYLVDGPGSAICTSLGHIVFPLYSNTTSSSTERASLMFSDDGGETWKRTDKISASTVASSEGELVELFDGTLRYFFRHYSGTNNHVLMYADATWDEVTETYTWSNPVSTGISCNSSTDLGAITYNGTIDEKQVVMVSVPSGVSGQYDRVAGRIFTFTVEEGNSLQLVNTYNFNTGAFGYSAMTMMDDDTVGLLYENGDSGSISFASVDPVADMGLTFDEVWDYWVEGSESGDSLTLGYPVSAGVTHVHTAVATVDGIATEYVAYDVTMCTDEEEACTDGINCSECYTGKAQVSIPIADVFAEGEELKAFVVEADGSIISIYNIENDGSTVEFETPHLSVVGVAALAEGEEVYYDEVNVTLQEGQTHTITLTEDFGSGSKVTDVAEITWIGTTVTVEQPVVSIGTNSSFSGGTAPLTNCLYTFTENNDGTWVITGETANGTTIYVDPYDNAKVGGYPNRTTSTSVTITDSNYSGSTNGPFILADLTGSNTGSLHFHTQSGTYYWNQCSDAHSENNSNGTHGIFILKVTDNGLKALSSISDLVSGEQYVIAGKGGDGNYYLMYPSVSTSDKYSHVAKYTGATESTETTGTEITIKALARGTASAVIGTTKYNVTVLGADDIVTDREVDVELYVGEKKTLTDDTGNYADDKWYAPDSNIATMTVKGVDGVAETTVSANVATTLTAGTYVILNTRAKKLVNNTSASASAAGGSMKGLTLSGTTASFDDSTAVWIITPVVGGYTVQDTTGKYMTISSNSCSVVDTVNVLSLAYENGTWTLAQNGAYLNDAAGAGTTASGWKDATAATDSGSQFTIYPCDTASNDSTEITFTGVSEGYTTAVVGTTKYNIHVAEAPEYVDENNSPFLVGGDFPGSANDGSGAPAEYLTKLTMSSVLSGFEILLDPALTKNAKSIEWSIADESIATFTVASDGTSVQINAVSPGTTELTCTIDGVSYTMPIVIVQTTTPGVTNYKYCSIHISGIYNTTVYYSWNCSGSTDEFITGVDGESIWVVYDSDKAYCINFYGAPDEHHALTFMSATNSEGHYLTLEDKENPKNCEFYNGGAGLSERTKCGFTDAQVAADIAAATSLGCDGAQGFSREASVTGACTTKLTFISDKLPEITKQVDGVLPTTRKMADYRRYAENMVAAVDEQVYFKITITLQRPLIFKNDAGTLGAIEYTNALMSDTVLEDAFLYTKELDNKDGVWDGEVAEQYRTQVDDVTDELNAAWAADETERVVELYLVYQIKESDIPKFYIDNIAKLDYNYKSHYSSGTYAASADAEARITVVGTAIDNVVIDFGQSFTYTGLTNTHLKGVYTGEDAGHTARYGDVEVTKTARTDENGNQIYENGIAAYDYTVTYTPTSILQGVDAVQLYGEGENGQRKVINGFLVYPATTVYYEEGFLLKNDASWPTEKSAKATTDQTFELLGKSQFDEKGALSHYASDKKHPYGFDPIYDGNEGNGEVDKSSASADKVGSTTSFTFTGTGFELYANCTTTTGYVSVDIRNAAGSTVKMMMVNTVAKDGDTSATTGQDGDLNSTPLVSVKDLEHGTYTVHLTKLMNDGKTVTLDGVRIVNTHADSTVFTIDLEDEPDFYQLRDMVLHAVGVQPGTDEDAEDLIGKSTQVYNSIAGATALITDESVTYADSATVQDLLDNGPKNELYLWAGQTLTFKVKTDRCLQLGLKAPRAETSYTLKVNDKVVGSEDTALKTSVDLFYELGNTPGTEQVYTISVKNTSNSILSVTDLKICDDPAAAFLALTEQDIQNILVDAGYAEPVCPSAAFTDVGQDQWYHEAVDFVVSNGLMNGMSSTIFNPAGTLNRAQIVTILYRLAGSPEVGVKSPFTDVPAESFYTEAVIWAVENGITNGVSATAFDPSGSVTREQMVTFLYRYVKTTGADMTASADLSVYTDASSVSTWAVDAFAWAVENGIISGMTETTLVPTANTNRAQIATVLMRYLSE